MPVNNYELVADQLYKDKPTLAPVEARPLTLEPAQNPYDAVADRLFNDTDSRRRSNVFDASSANPDQAARAKVVAQRLGTPVDPVLRNLPDAERQALIQDVDNGTAGSRVLRNAFSDPYFAKVAKDDVPVLSQIEKAVRRLLDPSVDDQKQTRAAAGQVGNFLAESAKQIGMGATVGVGAGIADVAGFGSDILAGASGSAQLEALAVTYRNIALRARESMDYFSDKAQGNLAAGFQSGLRSAGQNLILLPAGMAFGVNAALIPMVSMVGAGAFNKARDKGQSRTSAAIYAAPDAVFEYAFEKIPASRLLADIAKNSTLMKMVGNQLLPEVLGEQATTLLQDFNEWVRLNPQKTAKEFIAERPDAAIQTLVATLVGVGVQTGTVRGVQRLLGGASQAEGKAKDAEVHANQLGELFNIAAGSNLRGRDADSFAAFAQQVVEDSGSSNGSVYVDGAKLVEVLNQAKIDMAAFSQMSPTAAAELEAAAQSGGSVSIPIADLIGKMGDTGIEKNLLPHLRANEDAMSQEEAQFEQAAAVQVLQQQSDRIIGQAQESEVIEQSVEKVRTTMMDQLTAVGRFSPDVNRAYSTLIGSFYTVLGDQLGMTPEQAYATYPLQVQGVMPKGDVLNAPSIGDQLAARIAANYDAAVAEYSALPDTEGGRVINTDLARELSPEYRANRALSADVHEAASAFAKRRYAELLAGPVAPGKLPFVLATAGGAGAGKSSGLRAAGAESLANPDVTLDATLSVFDKAVKQLDQALASGREVRIAYTYRDPVDAFVRGALSRAMTNGRTVPLDAFVEGHVGSRATIGQLIEKYADDPRVQIVVIDNSRGAGKAAVTTVDQIPQVSANGLKELLNEKIQEELQAGRISEAVAAGTRAERVSTDSRPDRPGTGQSAEQQPSQADQVAQASLQQATDEAITGLDLREVATLDDFTPANLPGLLQKTDWSILTAADPSATKRSDAENATANEALVQDFEDMGFDYLPTVGKYGDTQPSFIVTGITEHQATALGRKYGQESVLTRKGLVYQDGSVTPALGIEVYDTAPEDFYTEIPSTGAFFSVTLDFDTRIPAPEGVLNQTGRAESDTKFQARARELLAGIRLPKRSAVAIFNGDVKLRLMPTNFDVARYFTRTNKLEDPTTPQATKAIVDALYADALHALSQSGSAVGWYDSKVKAALANMAILHPELATDGEAKFGFIAMLAITSNSTNVNENFEKAQALYSKWRETGDFPIDVPDAKTADQMREGLSTLRRLVTEHGWEKVRDFMVSDQAVTDIQAFSGKEIAGELSDSTIYGAVFLGSKIGAFFNNLYGNFTPVTMDRWFMRSMGRVQGNMLQFAPSIGVRLTALREQIDAGTKLYGQTAEALHAEIDAYEALPDRTNVEAVLKTLSRVVAYSRARFNEYARGGEDTNGKKHSFFPRTRENVLAKTIFEDLTLDVQSPQGGRERARLRGIMKALQQKLENDGIPIDMADLQAAIWYYEKDLFAYLKGQNRQASLFDGVTAEAEDYETASRRLVDGARARDAGPRGLGQQPVAKRAGPAAASGELFQGANPVNVTGTHFSKQARSNLNGALYGTGLRGLESERLRESTDPRLKSRVYFYVDEGTGVRPEAGVGGIAHSVPLQNLYDAKADADKLWRGSINDIESRILDAGFDGYYIRNAFNGQGAAVVIGDASRDLVATPLSSFERGAPVQSDVPVPYKRGLTSAELKSLNIEPVTALAPSARVRAGTFQVDQAEFAAARDAMAAQGIDLPAPPVLEQGARGTYSPSKMTISLLETADLTTFLHETGHFILDTMARVSSLADAPVQVREDMEKMLAWFGVKDLATWNGMTTDGQRQHHEKFAESFEQYLFEGKAPSRELTPLFQRFSSWMKSVYRSLTDFMRANNTQLSDEVRAVFDRMLATEEQIVQKQEDYNYSAMFSTRPPNMTDEEFAAYMLANQMATGEAMDELQARSLRDLRWVLNARSKEMKKLEKGVAEKRKVVEAEVRAEVQAQPVYAIQRWLKKGLTPDGTQTEGAKLNTDDLREIFGDGPAAPWRYLATNMISNERALSLHPDEVAQLFTELGFTSGEQMVREIVAAFPEEQSVQGLTDTRVLERHGDIASPQAIEAAANEAVHNEFRAKALATELKAMTQATQPVRVLQAAAKAFADRLIGGRRIKDVKPAEYERAEQRAAKRVGQMGAAGSTQDAVVAKRDQVLQFYAAKSAHQALEDVRKAKELFKKIVTRPDDIVGKSRDMDLVNVTRAILANYGFGGKAKSAHDYLNVLADHDPQTYEAVKDRVIAAELSGKPFAELTVDEMRTLVDEVQSLWLMARRSKQIEVDGKLVSLAEAQEALAARLDELGVPARVPGEGYAVTPGEQRLNMLQTFIASARRVESWISAKDGADVGPFRKYVFNAIKDAADNYRHDRGAYIKRYGALLKSIAPDMKRGMIDAPEIGYLFGKDSGGVGMNELLHALAHTGNASNKRKLLLGRGWATEMPDGSLDTTKWDSFVQRMITEGRLAKRHYDFVQGVWDMLESTKPQAQKMHRDVFGKYFNEVTADSFATPFGSYRGGYVPAMTDARVVSDKKTRDLAEEDNKTMAFAFPATNKGFTKSRVDYNRELMLDLRTLASHLDKVLLFSHMEGPVRDVRRVLTGKGVAYNLNRVDPTAFDSLLTPWLNRSANQQVETPVAGSAGMMRIFSGARANAGMAAMFANVSNTAQQITGLSIAAIRVPPRKLMTAMGQYIANPKDVSDAVAAGSVFMANRMDNEVSAMHNAISEILLDPSPRQKAKAWFSRHAYFMQAAVDNVIGPVVWLAARDDGLSQGMSELDARRHADGVVRTTQGSTLPEDISRIETGNAFVRTFTQFMGYFNMQANTVGTEIVKITDSIGLRAGAGRALYVLLFGALAPTWVAEAIAQAFKGGPGDEDEDGWYIDDWIKAVFGYGTLRTASAAVPVVGQVVNASVNAFNSKPYDDRIGSSPAIGMIESTIRAPVSVYKAILEDGNRQKAVRDAATAISMLTGIPVAGFARPLGYLAGVSQGKVEPTSPVDAARGLVTGIASPDSRQQ